MFGSFEYTTLQQYWWILISILGALLAFLLFVQGGQTMIYTLGKTDAERTIVVNALGRKWEFTFTTLVTFGGAFFASFPLFYSTSFGGAYWVWITILFAFVLQAVSYEYRTKPNNFLGKKVFEGFLFANGALGTILLGTAIATFFTGSQFSVNLNNILDPGNVIISQWQSPARGLEAALNLHNVSLGLAVFFLSRVIALLYFLKNIENSAIEDRIIRQLWVNAVPFLVFFLTFLVWLLVRDGFAVNPETGVVSMEPFKYLHNFLQMPLVLVVFLLGVVGVLWGIISAIFKKDENAIYYGGVGTVLAVLGLFLIAGLNNTAYYPSTFDLQSSLTIFNSSSSRYTLVTMSWVSLFIPVVLGYIYITWRSISNKKITDEEMQAESHVY